jgi:hypothetical protein
MRISVQPAKRDDRVKVIFDRTLTSSDLQPGAQRGASMLLVVDGLYDASHYRYTLEFAEEEMQLLTALHD